MFKINKLVEVHAKAFSDSSVDGLRVDLNGLKASDWLRAVLTEGASCVCGDFRTSGPRAPFQWTACKPWFEPQGHPPSNSSRYYAN